MAQRFRITDDSPFAIFSSANRAEAPTIDPTIALQTSVLFGDTLRKTWSHPLNASRRLTAGELRANALRRVNSARRLTHGAHELSIASLRARSPSPSTPPLGSSSSLGSSVVGLSPIVALSPTASTAPFVASSIASPVAGTASPVAGTASPVAGTASPVASTASPVEPSWARQSTYYQPTEPEPQCEFRYDRRRRVSCSRGRGLVTPSKEETEQALLRTVRMAPGPVLDALKRLYLKSHPELLAAALVGGRGTRQHKSNPNRRYTSIKWRGFDPRALTIDDVPAEENALKVSDLFRMIMRLPKRALFHDIIARALQMKQSQELFTYNGIITYVNGLWNHFTTSGELLPHDNRAEISNAAFRRSEEDREIKQTKKKKPSIEEYQRVMTELKRELRADPLPETELEHSSTVQSTASTASTASIASSASVQSTASAFSNGPARSSSVPPFRSSSASV